MLPLPVGALAHGDAVPALGPWAHPDNAGAWEGWDGIQGTAEILLLRKPDGFACHLVSFRDLCETTHKSLLGVL